MNTRERPRIDVIVSKSCSSLPMRAVGQEHHLAQECRVVGAMVGERARIGRQHLGAARRLERGDEGAWHGRDGRCRPDGVGKQRVHGVVEADHVESVAG